MGLYESLQLSTAKLINETGRVVNLVKTVAGTFNPATGLHTGDTTTTSTVKAVFVGIKVNFGVGTAYKFPIEEGDSIALVSADGAEPEQNNLIDGWTILSAEKVKPASTTVLYKCHVRKQ